MKPREKLVENIVDLVHARRGDENYDNLVKLLEATLKTHFAIGKWVPVSERLPIVGFMGLVNHKTYGKGLMRMSHEKVGSFFNEKCSAGISVADEIAHWLELDEVCGVTIADAVGDRKRIP